MGSPCLVEGNRGFGRMGGGQVAERTGSVQGSLEAANLTQKSFLRKRESDMPNWGSTGDEREYPTDAEVAREQKREEETRRRSREWSREWEKKPYLGFIGFVNASGGFMEDVIDSGFVTKDDDRSQQEFDAEYNPLKYTGFTDPDLQALKEAIKKYGDERVEQTHNDMFNFSSRLRNAENEVLEIMGRIGKRMMRKP